MRFQLFFLVSSICTAAAASAIAVDSEAAAVDLVSQPEENPSSLFKRKGGGGGGSRAGGAGANKPGVGGGSPGASRPDGTGVAPPKAMTGGVSRTGSGPRPQYGGGKYYPGGAVTPFAAGQRSPLGGIIPIALIGGALAFWPGLWLYGAYTYPYHEQYTFHNDTLTVNQTSNVICACAMNAECGCDDNEDTAYFDSLIGNGSYQALNKSVINVALVNGTSTLLINGTLPNGTTAVDPNSAGGLRSMLEVLGFWPVAVAVVATIFTV